MSSITGVSPVVSYAGVTTAGAGIDLLLGIIPNPDASHGTGAIAGGSQGTANTWLDEMSPAAAAQLRVELLALKTVVNLFEAP